MAKKAGSSLVLIASAMILIFSGFYVVMVMVLWSIISARPYDPPSFLLPYMQALFERQLQPLQILVFLLMVGLGVLLMVASRKMHIPDKAYSWSVLSFVLGFIIMIEFHGGGVFGGMTAGILSAVGGGLGLLENQKNHK